MSIKKEVGRATGQRCEANDKCEIGAHRYVVIDDVPCCETCNREADLSVCREHHVLPKAEVADRRWVNWPNASGQPRLADNKKEV